ncbi:MAG: hypothetical protein KDA24_25620, partial [Deltaproteobacteria bacterium]|nr:hypothetical protein [Deltaproteobacteria bacterium]
MGTPHRELARSAAGERVGSLAAESGLFQFHFEHRVALDLPEQWVPAHAPELAEPPPWTAGRLAERKYQSFRHDLAVGSFHPGQRGKWSAHELCHGLVGFAWHPGASPLFHATAGRLAELLPVALWYWFDEADRRRCPLHDGGGALFREYCRACDLTDGRSASDAAVIDAGRAYVRAELQAIERTLETGQVWPHRFATLDLSSDGVAYAVAHGERLRSPGFAGWMERFAVLGGGWSDSLSMLRERVEAVTAAVVDGAPLPPLAPSAEHGRWRWRVQDVAWRLQVVRSQCDGEAEARIGGILDALAAVIPTTEDGESDAATACREALAACAASYVELHEEWELLPPADLFALGHPLGVPACDALGDEGSRPHLADGLRTCAPASLAMAGGRGGDLVQGLLTRDRAQPRRDALADRWAKSLAADLGADDAIAQVARFEAATSVVPWRSRPVL